MYITTAFFLIMSIHIHHIINSNVAAFHNQGLQIFALLEQSFAQNKAVELSFEGIQRCSTQFLNAAIGKMYLQYDPARLNELIHYNLGTLQNLQAKIEEVKENAINSKQYDTLLENADG